MNILVTGGAGFMGSHIAEELVKTSTKVVVLDDLSGGFERNVPKGAVFINGSIVDTHLINEIFEQYKFEYVFHLAAYAAEGLSHFIRKFNYENNLIGSVNLINASVKYVKCFVFTSSIAVYGALKPPFTEEMPLSPEDPYGIAKYAVEMDLHAAHKMWGLNSIIFRPHNVYGERQNIGDKYRNVIGIFMNQVVQGKDITIFGDGEQKRAFTYIKDTSSIIAESIFNPKAYNQTFNIGSDKVYTVNELANLVLEIMGANNKIIHLPERNEVKNAYSSHKKASRILGYKWKTDLKEGVALMAQWVKQQGIRKSQDFSNIEVPINMPKSWR